MKGKLRGREHVFPKWLLELQDATNKTVEPIKFDADLKITSRRKHDFGSLLAGSVCANCNSGWMSNLEGEVQPILKSLILNEIGVNELSINERRILARWVCKTAYCIDSASDGRSRVPPRHRQKLREDTNSIPPGVVVAASWCPQEQAVAWLEYHFWRLVGIPASQDPNVLAQQSYQSYKIAMQLGNTILIALFWPTPTPNLGFERGTHIPLWPERDFFAVNQGEWPKSDSPTDFIIECLKRILVFPNDRAEGSIQISGGFDMKVFDPD
ncbi:MAG: hypothetical protein GC165_07635 [Armatimonadetes bacterium]|nr:hypothetical protein [Armatimonadota bacterium]